MSDNELATKAAELIASFNGDIQAVAEFAVKMTWYLDQDRADHHKMEIGMEKSVELHANLNRGVSAALGLDFGASWHDLPERVQKLVAELAELKSNVREARRFTDHGIPYYAYGDNEAACQLANDLQRIAEILPEIPEV